MNIAASLRVVCAASWTFPSLFVARRGKHSGEKLRHRRGDFARLACALCVRATASRRADLRVAAVKCLADCGRFISDAAVWEGAKLYVGWLLFWKEMD